MFGLSKKPELGTTEMFGLSGGMTNPWFGLTGRKDIWNVGAYDKLLTTGDSIADGSSATVGNSFRALLLDFYGWDDESLAVGGRGYYQQAANANDGNLIYTRATTIALDETGLNDIRRSISDLTVAKIQTCLYTILTRFFGGSGGLPSGNAGVTRSGTFSAFAADTLGGTYPSGSIPGNVATTSSTVGSTWTWTFSGHRHFFVGFSGSFDSTNARGQAEVYCDGRFLERVNLQGTFYDGVSDGTNDNKRGPVTRVYWDFDPLATHTVVVKVVSAANVPIDKFGTLGDPDSLGLFLQTDIPKVNDYWKAGLSEANDWDVDYFNEIRWQVVNEFKKRGYKCQRVRLNASSGGYYTLEGVDRTDYVHPLNYGHEQIFNSIQRYLTKWG